MSVDGAPGDGWPTPIWAVWDVALDTAPDCGMLGRTARCNALPGLRLRDPPHVPPRVLLDMIVRIHGVARSDVSSLQRKNNLRTRGIAVKLR